MQPALSDEYFEQMQAMADEAGMELADFLERFLLELKTRRLNELIQEGLESGKGEPLTDEMEAKMRARALERFHRGDKPSDAVTA